MPEATPINQLTQKTMAEVTISNEELKAKLQKSHLDEYEKADLAELIPQMTDDEKQETLGLIEQSQEVGKRQEEEDKRYQEDLKKLNIEYEEKMNQAVQDSKKMTVQEFEKAEKEDRQELNELEEELNQL